MPVTSCPMARRTTSMFFAVFTCGRSPAPRGARLACMRRMLASSLPSSRIREGVSISSRRTERSAPSAQPDRWESQAAPDLRRRSRSGFSSSFPSLFLRCRALRQVRGYRLGFRLDAHETRPDCIPRPAAPGCLGWPDPQGAIAGDDAAHRLQCLPAAVLSMRSGMVRKAWMA